jgi:hypothetical protein
MKSTASAPILILTVALLCGALIADVVDAARQLPHVRVERQQMAPMALLDPAQEDVVDDGSCMDGAAPFRTQPEGSWSLAWRAVELWIRPANELPLYDGFLPISRTFGRSL